LKTIQILCHSEFQWAMPKHLKLWAVANELKTFEGLMHRKNETGIYSKYQRERLDYFWENGINSGTTNQNSENTRIIREGVSPRRLFDILRPICVI